jgi:hypothetical protein
MLAAIENWGIADEESASDHNITFHITIEKDEKITNPPGFRFVIKEKQGPIFYEKFYSTISKKFHTNKKRGTGKDDELSRQVKGELDIRQFTAKLEAIQITCRKMYRIKESTPNAKGRTVPWWKTNYKEEKD